VARGTGAGAGHASAKTRGRSRTPKLDLLDMYRLRLVEPGSSAVLLHGSNAWGGVLLPDGRVRLTCDGSERTLSGAARVLTATTESGYDKWHVNVPGYYHCLPLSRIRRAYLDGEALPQSTLEELRRHGDMFKVSGYLRRDPYLADIKLSKLGNRARSVPGDSNLARARIAAGLTQEELAVISRVSASTIRRLERRQVRKPLPYLERLAYALFVPLGAVLD
jgi:DNA-binding XRE family transcriptional regulator